MRKIILLFFAFFSSLKSYSLAITVNASTFSVPQLVQNISFGTNGVPTICSGTNATHTATPTTAGIYNYDWTVPFGALAPGNAASFTTTKLGIYSVIITDPLTTCFSNPESATVFFNPIPTATISASTPSVCLNFVTPSPTITLTGIGGTAPYTFSYIFNGVPFTATTLIGNSVSVVVPTGAIGPQTYVLTNVQDANFTNRQTGTVVINVLDAPIINTRLTPYVVCNDDAVYNGIAIFKLHTKDLEVSSNPTLQISYYPTLEDATAGGILNQISPFPSDTYQNITSPFIQNVYIRVLDPAAPACYSITQLQLIVNPRPLKNLLLTPLSICDVTLPLILEPFDLHTKDADIINGETGVVVNYYLSESDAILKINAIPNQNAYTIPLPLSATQTIWYNASFTSNGCGTVGSLDLIVNPLPLATTPAYAPYNLCESTLVIDGIETFDLESKKQAILLGQPGVTVTFYPSPNDALNNTNLILTPTYTNVTAPFAQTLGIRLTNNGTGCYILSSINLIVYPKPTPQVPPASLLSICSTDPNGIGAFDLPSFTGAILQGAINTTVTYHLTNTDAQNNTNILPSTPFINIVPFSQILYVRATNTITGCFTVIMITITVSPSPTLPTLAPNLIKDLVFCDEDANNQDAITNVDLATQTAFLLGVQPGLASNFTVTYYTTLADATNSPVGLNPIITPATYLGTNNQDIWVRIENNTTKCFKVERFKIIINIPLVLPTPTILSLCDDKPPAVVTTPETTIFNLVSLSNPKILVNTLTPADFSVAYYLTQAAANAGTGAINSTAFLNTVNPQTLFVVVTSKEGCKSKSTLTLSVLKVPVPKLDPAELTSKCDDNVVGTPNPVGFEYFDLTTNIADIAGNLTDVTISYYQTLADATANPPVNAIANPANALVSGDVFIRVQSSINIDTQLVPCYVIVTQKLKVNPIPTVSLLDVATHPNNIYQECQNPSTLPQIKFNLDSLKNELLINNPTTNTYTTTFYTTAAGALAGTGAIANSNAYESTAAVSVAQTIYVRVVNNQTGCVNATGTFKIIVNPKPTITIPTGALALNTCDTDGVNDGLYGYPLDNPALISGILGGQSATAFTLTFHETQAEATSGAGAITNLSGYMGYTHSLWIRVQNNTTRCFEFAESKQIVEQIPVPVIETVDNINTICIDYITKYPFRTLELSAIDKQVLPTLPATSPTVALNYTYQWFIKNESGVFQEIPNATSATFLVNDSEPNGANRYYKVEMKSNSVPTPPLGCPGTSAEFEVIQSGPAIAQIGTKGYFVTNAFEQNQIITVTVVGYGTYQYSLDQGPRQDSPVFENVTLGSHEIEVFDNKLGLNSCDSFLIKEVKTIDYPYYFTPNGDGINDTWNINGLSKQFEAKIYIFDREGKLIKQIAPNGDGWDGNYNNSLMLSTDYWFTVDFTEQTIQKQFKSHFSLKR